MSPIRHFVHSNDNLTISFAEPQNLSPGATKVFAPATGLESGRDSCISINQLISIHIKPSVLDVYMGNHWDLLVCLRRPRTGICTCIG